MAASDVLAEAIANTLLPNPEQRRAAESFLESKQTTPGFSVALLQLIAQESVPIPVRQAAAVYLKNFTGRYYSHGEWEELAPADRNSVKSVIVNVVLSVPLAVRRQLSEVLAIISEHEYPKHWPSLVPELSSRIDAFCAAASQAPDGGAAGDWVTLQGVLETLNAIFERYPERMRSDELYTEINYSLKNTGPQLHKLFPIVTNVIHSHLNGKDPQTVDLIIGNAELLCKIFYCLSWQDVPEFFEDNMKDFMENIRRLLQFEDATIDARSEDEPSPLDRMHPAIIEILNLYCSKFDEDFRPYLNFFLQDVWRLLVKRSDAAKYDMVVTTGIKFLSTVSRSPDFGLFNDQTALSQVCNSIVVPNIRLREDDKELFEDNPVEYIRLDMEGSDSGTRRRGAVELVKGLCSHFEQRVTEIFSGYVSNMLSPQSSWEDRDAALFIVTALGWKSGTASLGATETSSLVNVVDFFNNQVLPELTKSANAPQSLEAPIFTADLIKYVVSFRSQIPKSSYGNVILICVKLLEAKEPVVRTYAAACIERLLTVKDSVSVANGNGVANGAAPSATVRVPRMTKEDMEPVLEQLLPAVVSALQNSPRPDEYIMRLVLRFCSVSKEKMRPYVAQLISSLVQVLQAVVQNPANPLFNHYLFEAISALIRFNGDRTSASTFENALMQPLHNILAQDVPEFGPYVFQVLSQLMMMHENGVPVAYSQLVGPLLNPVMWDRKGYIQSMVQFLETYVQKASADVLANSQLQPLLGVFNKLVGSRATDHLGLRLLCTIFENFEAQALGQHFNAIFSVLVVRLSRAKTSKYVQHLLYCLSLFVLKFGVKSLKEGLDASQPNLLDMLLKQVWVPEVASIPRPGERRVCALALADVGCATDLCVDEPYLSLWPQILSVTVALIEGIVVDQAPEVDAADEEEAAAHLGGGESYSAVHSQLQWGINNSRRSLSIAPGRNPIVHLAENVAKFTARHPGRFGNLISAKMEEGARNALSKYITDSRLTIS